MYRTITDILDSDKSFRSIVEDLLQSIKLNGYHTENFTVLCTHNQTKTFLVNERIVVKLSVSERIAQTDVAKCYKNWKLNNIPTLEVIKSGSTDSFEFLITKYVNAVDGDNLTLGSIQSLDLANQLGSIAAKLHSSKPSKILYLNSEVTDFSSWLEYNQEKLDRRCNRLASKGLISNLQIQKVQNKLARLAERKCDLVELHGDIGPHNALVDSSTGSIKALHDPDPLLGDPLFDIAYYIQALKREYKKHQKKFGDGTINKIPEIEHFMFGYKSESSFILTDKDLRIIESYESLLYINKLDYRSCYDPINELTAIKELLAESLI